MVHVAGGEREVRSAATLEAEEPSLPSRNSRYYIAFAQRPCTVSTLVWSRKQSPRGVVPGRGGNNGDRIPTQQFPGIAFCFSVRMGTAP